MDYKRNKLVLQDDKRRITSALCEWEQPQNNYEYLLKKPEELPDAVGETICAVNPYGLSFDRYGASYEYIIDGPVLLKMDSGRLFSLFGESIHEIKMEHRSEYLAYLKLFHNENPETVVQNAFRSLRGHTIIDVYYDERGVLEIDLDNCLTIESANGSVHEFSHIYLHERIA